jgi:SWI/SNF-related matrix-associated actin-dependent regulator 1 of chromatin subfamily A
MGCGVLIGDEMGLGKTIEAIGLINAGQSIRKVLVVCPNTLKANWRRELKKWLTRDLTVSVQDARKPWCGYGADVVVINYDLVSKFRRALQETEWDLRILDEVHFVKNHKARRTRFTLGIAAKRKIALTGTPIENRPVEIFSVLHDLDPDRWSNFSDFATRYCDAQDNGYGWDVRGHSNEEEFNQILHSTVMIRRRKEDVLMQLPPKRRQLIELDATGFNALLRSERQRHQRLTAELDRLKLKVKTTRTAKNRAEYSKAVKALRRGHGALFKEIAKVRHEIALAKLPQVIEFVENALECGKVIVFAHHLDVIARLKTHFPQAAVVTGEIQPRCRQDEVDRFQNDPDCALFLGNDAAGEGLTLTASSHVVFAESDWVPTKLAQKEDRAHRMGQRASILCSYLVLEGSLDAEMLRAALAKMEVIESVLD